jgi:hypothetical protein
MANIYGTNSRYKDTEITDFYLDIWNADNLEIEPTDDDEQVTIESKYDRRPDLFAYDHFGDSTLWWRLAMRNKDILIDPINDFLAGTQIWVPARGGNRT